MKQITLKQVVEACGGKYYGAPAKLDTVITDITTDSRKITKDCLFVPIVGERFDAHDFIDDTLKNGALCSLSQKMLDGEKSFILVESTQKALRQIAAFYRSLFKIPFIGVTGSVGKTSTKEMIYSVLSQKFNVMKTIGNFNNEIGVPITLFTLEDNHQAAVVEMGISDFGEMDRLSEMVKPDICVITNIGTCHLENLKDRDGVLKAKTEMFNHMSKNGRIFLNGDDDKLAQIKDVRGIKPEFFGIDSKNKYYGELVNYFGVYGIRSALHYDGGVINVTIPAIGNYMISNAAVAVAVGKALGLDDEQIKKGIENYKTVGSRDNLINTEFISIIDDCYNANPVSVKGSIETLCGLNGRHICILGDMKELGENEKELHYSVGKYAAEKCVDTLIAIGPLSKNTADGATDNKLKKVYHFKTCEEAISKLSNIIKRDDIILVKGSRAMRLEQIVNALQELELN